LGNIPTWSLLTAASIAGWYAKVAILDQYDDVGVALRSSLPCIVGALSYFVF